MYEDTKNNLFQRYRNKQLMDEYERRKQYEAEKQNRFSNGIGNTFKALNGINKVAQLLNKPYQPSAVGNAINFGNNANLSPVGNAINSNVMGNAGNIGSEIGNASSAAEGASSAAGGAGQALGAAGSALAVGLDAKNMAENGINFNNGTDMAADAASLGLMATGVGAPAAAAVQAAKFIKNMVTGAIEKKKQESMQASMKGAAEEQEKSMNNLAEQQQGLEEQRQNNMAKLQNQIQTMQQLQDNNALAQNALGQVTDNQDYGQITGGAAPVSMPTNYVEENTPTMTPEENQLIEQNQQIQQPQQLQQEDLKQSLMDKIRSGMSDFSAGYQDNANTDFAHGDLMNGITTGGAAPVQQGNTFNLGASQNKKGAMARLGELAGTGQRIASHPLTQAGIAALISKAAGGGVDDMAKAALQYGTQKAQADRYYQQITGNTDRPFLNSYSAQDVTNKRLEDQIAQKQQQWMYEQMIKQAQQDYNNQFNREKFDYQKQKDAESNALKREEIATRREYYRNRGNGGRQQAFDPTTVSGFYDDYDRLEQMKNMEEGSDEYNNELNDVLDAMYQGQKDGWWGKYSDEQINAAKQRMKEAQRQYERDFNKKYRINPLKGKKS